MSLIKMALKFSSQHYPPCLEKKTTHAHLTLYECVGGVLLIQHNNSYQ